MTARKKTVHKRVKREGSKFKKTVRGGYKQTGKRKSLTADRKRRAKKPGWRMAKTGNVYFESRRNRSDAKHKSI